MTVYKQVLTAGEQTKLTVLSLGLEPISGVTVHGKAPSDASATRSPEDQTSAFAASFKKMKKLTEY